MEDLGQHCKCARATNNPITVTVDEGLMKQPVLRQVGAGLYASRVPERWAPGKFDLLWNSHNLFHLAVVMAALIHYKSVLLLLSWRDSAPNCL